MKDIKPVAWLVVSEYFLDRVFTDYGMAFKYLEKRNSGKIKPLYAIPDGCVVVPVEPTLPMLAELGFNGDVELAAGHADICDELRGNYKAMLKAAQEEG